MATELRGQSTNHTIRALAVGEGAAICAAYSSCYEAPAYRISYTQKTPKGFANNADHEASRDKNVCVYHGVRFAKMHGLALPAPRPVTVNDVAA